MQRHLCAATAVCVGWKELTAGWLYTELTAGWLYTELTDGWLYSEWIAADFNRIGDGGWPVDH